MEQGTMVPQNKPLTSEEFVERDPTPRYDGFPSHFMPGGIAPHLRQTPYFLDFQAKKPDLEARLTQGITNRDRSIEIMEALKPFEPDMYEAYRIMFEYLVEHNSANPNEDLLIAPK